MRIVGDQMWMLLRSLDALGYTVVPEASLWSAYNGASARSDVRALDGGRWWTRYFDYL